MSHYKRINAALNYVEDHLTDPLNIQVLAREACMSEWHFQRIFQALIGHTCMRYVRRRRLSWSAEQLIIHHKNILDVAVDCQFASQEAFTRAFKTQFNRTPGSCRDIAIILHAMQPRIVITASYLNSLFGDLTMEPTLKHLDDMLVAGISAAFIPEKTASTVIPKLWNLFLQRKSEIASQKDASHIGIVNCLPILSDSADKTELVYLAATPVTQLDGLPAGMWATKIGASDYAFFKTSCKNDHISKTIDYIYGSWLPHSGYERGDGPELEFYPEGFDEDENMMFEIAVPIRR